jgi:hypothetical protein
MPMSGTQKLITRLVPRRWAESMEAESRTWMMRCPCGHEQSVWEAGGIRWKAAGNPRRRARCPGCGEVTWQQLYKKSAFA